MKRLIRAIAKSVGGFNRALEDDDDLIQVPHVKTREEQDEDLVARVRAFNRVPLHSATAVERKKEADTMRNLKDWIRRLSDNDRAIVMGRKPWEIMNHIQGIVLIEGVVAQGLAASYHYAPTIGAKFDFEVSNAIKNSTINVPTGNTRFEARGLSQVSKELQGKNEAQLDEGRKKEYAYTYEPPRPSAAFMAAHGKYPNVLLS